MSIIHLDKAIIEGIKSGDQKFENILFERFRGIENTGVLVGENEDDKFQLYIDTITDVILQIRKNKTEIQSLKAYIKTILKNKYSRFLKQKIENRKTLKFLEDMPYFELPDTLLEDNEAEIVQDFVNESMSKVSEKCRDLLKAKYYKGLKFEEIAEELNIASSGAARVKNHDCLKSIRQKNKDLMKKYYE